ncbi:hypothetical protein Lpp219_13112 [Lacticaseibacillus paracasei subsp. paracasei Lpp219]|nr:hypothetical protein Lpp219_13112 [Lacticaseibacillus paracasei subsp. paracasei Lpp219]
MWRKRNCKKTTQIKLKVCQIKNPASFFDRNVQNRSIKLVHKDPVPPKPKMPDSASSKNKD